jgi:hypothetical protein
LNCDQLNGGKNCATGSEKSLTGLGFIMSKCHKCGIDVVCNIPHEVKMHDGRIIKGFKSAPHGCPPEYDHFKFSGDQIGFTKKDFEQISEHLQRQQNGGTLTQ